MSNTKKDGDFNLDQELLSKKAAIESGEPLSDDHEDEKIVAENVQEISDLVDEEYRNGHSLVEFEPAAVLFVEQILKHTFFPHLHS